MADIILQMKHITKAFSGVKALDDVNLTVERGEIHALCGENGAGKSTLMNILSAVYPYGEYSGKIIYNGEECKFRDIRESQRKGIVIIHQELALTPNLSIAENLFLGNEITSFHNVIDWDQTREKAKDILEKVGLPNENVNMPVRKLSVGKQQLVEVAKALVKRVELLILDEPTASLNDEDSKKLLNIIKGLKERGITCIMISHKLNELSQIADSITVLRDGRTIETLQKGKDDMNEDRIIRGMVGRELTNQYPSRERKIGEVAFEVRNWTVHHPEDPGRIILNHVNFHVKSGEVVGFAGLMGAGRTELAMSIFGRAYGGRTSGEIYKNGKQIILKNVQDAINNGIAYASEDRKSYGLVLNNDVKWNMTLSSLWSQFSSHWVINRNDEIIAADDYRKKLDIRTPSIRQTTASLSGGNQQKVVLAKWILTRPDVLILDEPTRGIDVGAKYEIYEIINDLANAGKAVVFISSEMPELLGICDRIYVLNQGEIAGELNREEFSQEKIMKMIMSHIRREKQVI